MRGSPTTVFIVEPRRQREIDTLPLHSIRNHSSLWYSLIVIGAAYPKLWSSEADIHKCPHQLFQLNTHWHLHPVPLREVIHKEVDSDMSLQRRCATNRACAILPERDSLPRKRNVSVILCSKSARNATVPRTS